MHKLFAIIFWPRNLFRPSISFRSRIPISKLNGRLSSDSLREFRTHRGSGAPVGCRSRMRQGCVLNISRTPVARSLAAVTSGGRRGRRQRQGSAATPRMLRCSLELGPRLTRQISRRHIAARYELRRAVQMRRRHYRRLLCRLSAVSHLSHVLRLVLDSQRVSAADDTDADRARKVTTLHVQLRWSLVQRAYLASSKRMHICLSSLNIFKFLERFDSLKEICLSMLLSLIWFICNYRKILRGRPE